MRQLRLSSLQQRMRSRAQSRGGMRDHHARQGEHRRGRSDGAGRHLLANFGTTRPADVTAQSQDLGHCSAYAFTSVRVIFFLNFP
jgi:hypothetical protein